MASFRISYVVVGGGHPGAIVAAQRPPQVGERVELGGKLFEVIETHDVLPLRGGFAFVHATVRPVEAAVRGPARQA